MANASITLALVMLWYPLIPTKLENLQIRKFHTFTPGITRGWISWCLHSTLQNAYNTKVLKKIVSSVESFLLKTCIPLTLPNTSNWWNFLSLRKSPSPEMKFLRYSVSASSTLTTKSSKLAVVQPTILILKQ